VQCYCVWMVQCYCGDGAVLVCGDGAVLVRGDGAELACGDGAELACGDGAVLVCGDGAVLVCGEGVLSLLLTLLLSLQNSEFCMAMATSAICKLLVSVRVTSRVHLSATSSNVFASTIRSTKPSSVPTSGSLVEASSRAARSTAIVTTPPKEQTITMVFLVQPSSPLLLFHSS